MENNLMVYQSVITDIKNIINAGQQEAYGAASKAMVLTYWNVGKRIVKQEQAGKEHAEYGKKLLVALSDELTKEYGNGYSERNLRYFRKFYQYFPDKEIWNACVPNLNWTQFRSLLRVSDENARIWYMNEAAKEGWSSRTLDRNISTQYYNRLLQSPQKENVIAEMKQKTAGYQKNSFELLKNPIMAEFLGFKNEDSYLESDLEAAIISHIRDFLMEMGRGFAFVARQQHIVTETEDYYIDLVFYNIELKCYVLIDLKMGKITHQDVGQIDIFYNRNIKEAYEQLKASEQEYKGEKPVIKVFLLYESMTNTQMIVGSLPEIFEQDPRCYIMTIDDLEMLLATYKKDKSRFDDVVKALVENKRGGNDYKSVLEILNIYQAVGDMHFIGERDYFNKIAEKLKKELGTDQ